MWDLDEDYPMPRYLLWAGLLLGSTIGLLGSGALITALITTQGAVDLVGVLGMILLILLSFMLLKIIIPELRSTPDTSAED